MTLPAGKYSINQVLTDLLATFSPWWSHVSFFLWKAVLCISARHRCIITEASGAAEGLDLSLYLLGKEQCTPPGSHMDAGRELIFHGKWGWSHRCTPAISVGQPLFCVLSTVISQLSLDAWVQPVSYSKRNWEQVSFSVSAEPRTLLSQRKEHLDAISASSRLVATRAPPLPFPEGRRVAFNSKFSFNEHKMNEVAGELNLVNRAAAERARCLRAVMDPDFPCWIHRSIKRTQVCWILSGFVDTWLGTKQAGSPHCQRWQQSTIWPWANTHACWLWCSDVVYEGRNSTGWHTQRSAQNHPLAWLAGTPRSWHVPPGCSCYHPGSRSDSTWSPSSSSPGALLIHLFEEKRCVAFSKIQDPQNNSTNTPRPWSRPDSLTLWSWPAQSFLLLEARKRASQHTSANYFNE